MCWVYYVTTILHATIKYSYIIPLISEYIYRSNDYLILGGSDITLTGKSMFVQTVNVFIQIQTIQIPN